MSHAQAISPIGIIPFLEAEGFTVPRDCTSIDVLMPSNGVATLRYDMHMSSEQVEAYGRALQAWRSAADDATVERQFEQARKRLVDRIAFGVREIALSTSLGMSTILRGL